MATDTPLVNVDLDRPPNQRRVSSHLPGTVTPPDPGPPHRPRQSLGVDTLADIAVGLARAEGLWRPHVSHDPLSRTAVRLVATDVYEVWLLGWTIGQRVELHDHGGSNAAFVVLEGTVEEIRLGFAGTTTATLHEGAVSTVPAGTVHDVVNPSAVSATSLHVYADPLATMTFYDHEGSPTHTDLVEHVPAILDSSGVTRTLHPRAAGTDRDLPHRPATRRRPLPPGPDPP